MHLKFSDTSPLKIFVSSLRGKRQVYIVDQLLTALTVPTTKDRRLLLAMLAACIPCKPEACVANTLKWYMRRETDGKEAGSLSTYDRFSRN